MLEKKPTNWSKGLFLKRYKRFFADIQTENGQQITAHLPNTGSLKSCLEPLKPCYYSASDNPNRKLPYTLEALKPQKCWVGVNTRIAESIYEDHLKKQLTSKQSLFTQVPLSKETRIDFVISLKGLKDKPVFQDIKKAPKNFHLIEVKSATFKHEGLAQFPDAVTTRGQKHLKELMAWAKKGAKAELVFVIQRSDCTAFRPADFIDPEYGKLLRMAYKQGVKITPLACKLNTKTKIFQVEKKVKLLLGK